MKVLLVGGIACACASLLHILIMIGGADWYRLFGAGEETARLVEQGSLEPLVSISFITIVLAIFSFYAIYGALRGPFLPFFRAIMSLISALFMIRGIIGIPMVLWIDNPYMAELRDRMLFMSLTSLVSFSIGGCYLYGLFKIMRRRKIEPNP